ncbi:NYN domain-containing protein [Patescibacteria group bacterium]|nr:NYN domain-containing protein [Patescibacteria group bacterium]
MLSTQTRRVGVFIDVQNMYYSARNLFDRKVNFSSIVKDTVGDAQLIRAIAYTISTKGGEETAFFDALRGAGIEVKSKELLEYAGGAKKGDWDVGVAVDIIRMLDMLDVVVLVSGDGDFVPLADYVRSRGRIFHVASFRESTSGSLVEAADQYTNFSDDKRKFLIGGKGKEKVKPDEAVKVQKSKAQTIKEVEENRSRRLSF